MNWLNFKSTIYHTKKKLSALYLWYSHNSEKYLQFWGIFFSKLLESYALTSGILKQTNYIVTTFNSDRISTQNASYCAKTNEKKTTFNHQSILYIWCWYGSIRFLIATKWFGSSTIVTKIGSLTVLIWFGTFRFKSLI